MDDDAREAEACRMFDRLKSNFTNINDAVVNWPSGQHQVVSIGRAIYFDARNLVMDESRAGQCCLSRRRQSSKPNIGLSCRG